jgi:hypothetical protein
MLKDIDPDDDYEKLLKVVLDAALVDFIKLQHPKNRNKKYLEEALDTSVELFFDPDFRFEYFFHQDDPQRKYSLKEVLIKLLNTRRISMEKVKQHVVDESISYWWEKNFHDIKIPAKINLAGKVFYIVNSKQEQIDFENNKLYFASKKLGADRVFFKLCLKVLIVESGLDFTDEQLEYFYKYFYLFLKINDAFSTLKMKDNQNELD